MEIYLAATWSDGSVSHEAMQLDMRAPTKPLGNWAQSPGGSWHLEGNDADVDFYMARVAERVLAGNGLTLVGWRRLSEADHQKFSTNRQHRNALEDVDGEIRHNMVKARAIHKELLRHVGIEKLLVLDGKENAAASKKDDANLASILADKQAIRDAFDDPRIDAAQTIEELLQVVVPDVATLQTATKG
jgi:hypothetical protein